jgi:GWxTD domain-containing protein
MHPANGALASAIGAGPPASGRSFVHMRAPAFALAWLFFALWSTPAWSAADLVVEAKVFHMPGKGPRVEVNLAVLAGSLMATTNERGFRHTKVEVITLIESDGAIRTYAKTVVMGEERLDTLDVDLVHSEVFALEPGIYDLVVEVRDLVAGDTEAAVRRSPLVVGELPPGISFSDIMFAERMDKVDADRATDRAPTHGGYALVPLVGQYFPPGLNNLEFYCEIYGAHTRFGEDSLYLLTYQIERMEDRTLQGQYKRMQRLRARPAEAVVGGFDISALPTGNYLLALEVRDRAGQLVLRREQMLQRNNPILYAYDLQALEQIDVTGTFAAAFTLPDTLAEHIRSLRPIADPLERKIIDDRWKDRDMELMKRFFYSFWANRSADPAQAWRSYREQVVKVNRLFSCRVLKGYETDRGYIYLKYGAPNTMMDRFNEMDAYPYTIWHYYRAGKYTNRRFVFYQPSLASDCLELIHAEVPGEINNPRWNQIIHSRNVAMPNVDPARVNTLSGERADEFFEIPR